MIARYTLSNGYSLARIIKGGWHLAGDHGAVDRRQAIADMAEFVAAGITTFDCADIYTGVEQLIGDFRRAYPSLAPGIQVHTKLVPNLSELHRVDGRYVEDIIDRSLQRLGMERLDLVQFHWWDYNVRGYIETALELERLRRAGKIAQLGLTNFDTQRVAEIVAAGVSVVAHQVQYSLLDERPAAKMVDFCRAHDIVLLCYGTVAGGFLSERWLGKSEPEPGSITNRSLIKYQLIIEDFGGWDLFQELLTVLARIAVRHDTDIASIASSAVLERSQVAAIIVGATNASHLPANAGITSLSLDPNDMAAIDAVTRRRTGPAADVYTLERDRTSKHGSIMKYELNTGSAEK